VERIGVEKSILTDPSTLLGVTKKGFAWGDSRQTFVRRGRLSPFRLRTDARIQFLPDTAFGLAEDVRMP